MGEVMNGWRKLFNSWGKGQIKPLYLFHGEEEFIKKEALEIMRSAILPIGLEMLNESLLEGNVSADRIIEDAEMLPVMWNRRLVVVKDWAPLLPGGKKDKSADADRLLQWLPNAPETCTLLFYVYGKCEEDKKKDDKKKGAQKSSIQLLKERMTQILFSPLDDVELREWIQNRVQKAGVQIDGDACKALISIAGRDLSRLVGEVDKLASYAGKGNSISAEDVEAVVTPTTEGTVFNMIDSLTAGNFLNAEKYLQKLADMGEKRTTILYMITRQMRHLYITRALLDCKAATTQKVQSVLSVPYFGAKRLIEQAQEQKRQNISIESLERAYRECVDTDYAIKSGRWRNDEAALDRVMVLLNAWLNPKKGKKGQIP